MEENAIYTEFIQNNRAVQNRHINRVIRWSIIVGPAIAVGVYFGAFAYITYFGCLIATALILGFWLLDTILLHCNGNGRLTVYVGLLGLEVVVGVMANFHIGIYLTFFIMPFLSLLYCDRKIYLLSSLIGYLGMVYINVMIAEFNADLRPDLTPLTWFSGHLGGYSIEYIVMFIGGLALNSATRSHFYELFDKQMEVYAEKEYRERIVRISNTDALTGLPNRQAYMTAEEQTKQDDVPADLVVVQFDVNGLKRVNDTLGHTAGDRLIIAAADCISDVFSPYGTCYRVGGDEFIALLRGVDTDEQTLIERLERAAAERHGTQDEPPVSVSCGMAAAADHPDEGFDALLKLADDAMYRRKSEYYVRTGLDRRKV